MAKPIVKTILPFDAHKEQTITFTYTGDQPYSNKMIIYDATTLNIVYQDTESTMQFKHTLPANKLTNGKQYAVTIQCFDNDDVASAESGKIFFWCFTTPTFEFDNLRSGNTIKSSSLTTNIRYTQKESEPLAETKFYLYDSNKTLLSESSMVYSSQPSYTYSGFENQSNYFVRAVGQTEHGFVVDTDYIRIFIRFDNPAKYAMIYANQDKNGTGTVNYWTNVSVVRPTREDYVVNDSKVDIRNDYITYDSNFVILDDYTIALNHSYTVGKLLELSNDDGDVVTLSMEENNSGFRYVLTVNDTYKVSGDNIDAYDFNLTKQVVYIRNVNGVYGIYPFYDIWFNPKHYKLYFNTNEPSQAKQFDLWADTGIGNGYSTEDNVIVKDVEPESPTLYTVWIGGN